MNRTPNSAFRTTSLHGAAESGDLAWCRQLVNEGAEIHTLDESGWSPLIHAVQQDHVEIARFLLQQGAPMSYHYQRENDPEERAQHEEWLNRIRQTAASIAAKQQILDVLPPELHVDFDGNAMVDMHFQPHSEHAMESASSIEMFELLITEFGADLNHVDDGGYWPLLSAAEAGDLDLVRWLLDHGADPNQTSTGETAIFKAIREDRMDIILLLVERGADLGVIDVDGWSPLFACHSLETAKFLIENGADPTITDQADFPCWHFVKDSATREFLQKTAMERGLESWTDLDDVYRKLGHGDEVWG